jgi:pimeloyl-ACP methyl ester carboxylesterase
MWMHRQPRPSERPISDMKSLNRRKTIQGLLLVSTLLLASCSKLHEPSATDRLKPCTAAEGPTDGYCGTFDVWEDRQARSGRKIALKILVLPALKQDYAHDPLFILAGGPGQGATELVDQLQEIFRPIEMGRDIVVLDQRGTGNSNPLECKTDREIESQADPTAAMVNRLHACLDSYKKIADVTKYTTEIAMADLDDVRQFLGYSKINLYGGSYGTRVAMVYARRHPGHTRAVILDGVAPTDMELPLFFARDSQRALDLLLQDCERDTACNLRFPNLRQRLQVLLARLSVHPQHIRYADPRTGLQREMDLRRFTLTSILFAALYSPEMASTVPLLIEQAEQGNFSGFLALRAAYDPITKNMAQGMHFSVVCSEDAPRIEPGAVKRESVGTFLGAEMAEARLKPCEFWPPAKIEPAYYVNSPSNIPALILSGELDPVTPPSWGQRVASQWKNSRHIVVPGTGHGTLASGCVMKLMAEFLNEDDASKLDTSCVEHLKRPPFFLDPSGPDEVSR